MTLSCQTAGARCSSYIAAHARAHAVQPFCFVLFCFEAIGAHAHTTAAQRSVIHYYGPRGLKSWWWTVVQADLR